MIIFNQRIDKCEKEFGRNLSFTKTHAYTLFCKYILALEQRRPLTKWMRISQQFIFRQYKKKTNIHWFILNTLAHKSCNISHTIRFRKNSIIWNKKVISNTFIFSIILLLKMNGEFAHLLSKNINFFPWKNNHFSENLNLHWKGICSNRLTYSIKWFKPLPLNHNRNWFKVSNYHSRNTISNECTWTDRKLICTVVDLWNKFWSVLRYYSVCFTIFPINLSLLKLNVFDAFFYWNMIFQKIL